ncbi:hypothetical protein [Rhizobium rosettiformans]|uniref:hypothetical protein n=1 Tax=Rhizobium rosettiformans TaxID=1368430 RepID=UPI00285E400E|nr:hypothetical protein [Rhizobium rosettiformans]MDR7028996.1 hypothetical protein [Rhizobium rosettiformans]MDR7063722.1 hypothetical protein [Rhizobium rosettiformans]
MSNVYFIGSKYWCDYLAEKLGDERGLRATAVDLSSIKSLSQMFDRRGVTIVVVGLGARVSPKRIAIWAMLVAFWIRGFSSNRIVFYWIGSDVLSLGSNRYARIFSKLTKLFRAKHICGAPWFVDELQRYGIRAQPVLFPYDTEAASVYADAPLPVNPFTICTYLTSNGWKTLEGHRILHIAAQTPDVRWVVMGMNENDIPKSEAVSSNVTFTGWVDNPLAVQSRCHALLRLVRHDAFSGVVRDALAMRRLVLYSLPVKGAYNVGGKSDCEIADIVNNFAAGSRYSYSADVHDVQETLKPFAEQIDDLRRAIEG